MVERLPVGNIKRGSRAPPGARFFGRFFAFGSTPDSGADGRSGAMNPDLLFFQASLDYVNNNNVEDEDTDYDDDQIPDMNFTARCCFAD